MVPKAMLGEGFTRGESKNKTLQMCVHRLSKELDVTTTNFPPVIIPTTSNRNPQLSPITDSTTTLTPSTSANSRTVLLEISLQNITNPSPLVEGMLRKSIPYLVKLLFDIDLSSVTVCLNKLVSTMDFQALLNSLSLTIIKYSLTVPTFL